MLRRALFTTVVAYSPNTSNTHSMEGVLSMLWGHLAWL